MKTRLLCIGATWLALRLVATAAADYVAHEWGTFTSVQGSDGVQMSWNPLLLTDLPKFVYDRNRPLGGKGAVPGVFLAAKTGMSSRQRLETPVIYFYSEAERRVDVSVMFPEGKVTEWYPQQNPLPKTIVRAGDPAAQWRQLRILAAGTKAAEPPTETTGNHYYAARETDANRVEITPGALAPEVDKFLFYRGVGNFEAPLNVVTEGDAAITVQLTNTGREPLAALFIYEVRGDRARLAPVAALRPGELRKVVFDETIAAAPQSAVRADLEKQMVSALTAAGLKAREALAMVKTWDDAWFAEAGLRVLYVLPRAWADRTLPLTLDPVPRELVRVMVGRAEILPRSVEKTLTREIERYRTGDGAARAVAVQNARSLSLGRFAEPAVRRVCHADPKNQAFGNAAWELLFAAYAPPTNPLPATAQR